ncbi:MAG: TIGR00282 family metallophosphoesterase [Hyphomicrobiales bacterium]|nr:TIGR00282 family metallophosphoesterase [Hyphomicrobiales bacterium]
MRILFLGDVLGRAGRSAVCRILPDLKSRQQIDFVIVNGENAAGGFGITQAIFNDLINAGADVVTTGNHVWDQRETLIYIEREPRLLRPVNFPPGTPGSGAGIFRTADGASVMVIQVMGRLFMDPMDCPFQAVERELGEGALKSKADAIFVEIHAEATSEKQALAHFADGRVTAVVGTHTHVPTADAHLLPGSTAYMTDAGMCGDYQSVIGMKKDEPVQRFQRKIASSRFEPAMQDVTVCGAIVEVDDATGLALSIEPVRIGGVLGQAEPQVVKQS